MLDTQSLIEMAKRWAIIERWGALGDDLAVCYFSDRWGVMVWWWQLLWAVSTDDAAPSTVMTN